MLIILEFILKIQAFKEFGKVFLGTQLAKMEINEGVGFPFLPLTSTGFSEFWPCSF